MRHLLQSFGCSLFLLAAIACDDDVVCDADSCEGGAPADGGSPSDGGAGGSPSDGGAGGDVENGGAGGEGGSPKWTIPECETVSGTAGVAIALDAGATLVPSNAASPSGTRYTFGITVTDRPNELYADFGGTLLHSDDAGCTWTEVGSTNGGGAVLAAAPHGAVIGWTDNASDMYRADELGISNLVAPVDVVGLGIDTRTSQVRIVGSNGSIWSSADDGEGWTLEAEPPMFADQLVYRAAFNPNNIDEIIVGMAVQGAWLTRDGGETWKQSIGLSTGNANAFSLAISPVDPTVVWLQGIDLTDDTRHLYRSADGGESFNAVVAASEAIVMTNGVPLFAHPRDPNIALFEFGTYYGNYGTDLYRYDHASGDVSTNHYDYDEVKAVAFSPADPDVLYLGITFENIQ